ncbi:MAG: hypothetical protein ACYTHJ_00070 [Planctomycetota bacterium]|jgi:hypothetical protein
MQKRNGGRSGKSRHAHQRRRADRLYESQLIDEYLSDEDKEIRHIPIRHRAEFHPTVAKFAAAQEPLCDAQLELPLTDHLAEESNPESSRPGVSHHSELNRPSDTGPATRKPSGSRTEAAENMPQPLANNHYEMFEFRTGPAKEPFSFRRFFVGCALGGGLAAALLLIVQLVF